MHCHKNHALLFEAISLLQKEACLDHTQFSLVGDGQLRTDLQSQAQQLGILPHLQFLGWQSDMPCVYESLHLTCLTSRNEGTPVALIEAMAAGRPIVATDVGGVRWLLGGQDSDRPIPRGSFEVCPRGLLVRSEDPQGLSHALRHGMRHPELLSSFAQAGRQFAESHFCLKRLIQDIDRLYRRYMSV